MQICQPAKRWAADCWRQHHGSAIADELVRPSELEPVCEEGRMSCRLEEGGKEEEAAPQAALSIVF